MYYIYKATNLINGKVYIGQTVDFKRRKTEHLSSKNGVHARCVFHKAIQKYGKHNFVWEIIDKCTTLDEATELETKYINKYNSCVAFKNSNGYNIVLRQEKNNVSHNSIPVIAYDKQGNFINIYTSCLEASRELKCQETNIIKCLNGKRKSCGGYQFIKYIDNYPLKINAYKTNELKAKYKKVFQYDLQLNLLKIHHSVTECAKSVNGNRNSLSKSIKNQKPYKGFIFMFE